MAWLDLAKREGFREAVRRRRECQACRHRFTTFERVELPELILVLVPAAPGVRASQAYRELDRLRAWRAELDATALAESGIQPTTMRLAVGDEDPKDLITHFIHAARLAIDPFVSGFSQQFAPPAEIDALVRETYLNSHQRHIDAKCPLESYQI